MNNLADFLITRKWPPQHPKRLQLYSVPTPNGVKVSLLLEESGIPYEPHFVRFKADEQKSPEFTSLNPNGKIPAIIDPNGPGGRPLGLFESGAILVYLADKIGQFVPTDAAGRYEVLQWVMFQVGGIGPFFGQLGFFFKMGGKDIEDKRSLDHFTAEARRLLGVLEQRLSGRTWLLGELYTIADMAVFPWVRALTEFYQAGELVGMSEFPEVARVLRAFDARPALQRALKIPAESQAEDG